MCARIHECFSCVTPSPLDACQQRLLDSRETLLQKENLTFDDVVGIMVDLLGAGGESVRAGQGGAGWGRGRVGWGGAGRGRAWQGVAGQGEAGWAGQGRAGGG